MNLMTIMGIAFFAAGVVFFVTDDNAMGSSMVALGVAFSVIAKQQSDSKE